MAVALDQTFALVGAPYHNASGLQSGAAYIFEKGVDGNWNEAAILTASDGAAGHRFGSSVAVFGNFALVGAPLEGDNTSQPGSNIEDIFSDSYYAGAAYLFERNGDGAWVEIQKLVASDRDQFDQFGNDLAIYGSVALIGASNDEADSAISGAGSAYVFTQDADGIWSETQKLQSPVIDQNDFYGHSVAISDEMMVIAAYREEEDAAEGNTLTEAGAAYLYQKDDAGNWDLLQKVVASDRSLYDLFGASVDVYHKHAVIGAHWEDHDSDGDNELNDSGSVYFFDVLNSTIGLDENHLTDITLYPNPVSEQLILQSNSTIIRCEHSNL